MSEIIGASECNDEALVAIDTTSRALKSWQIDNSYIDGLDISDDLKKDAKDYLKKSKEDGFVLSTTEILTLKSITRGECKTHLNEFKNELEKEKGDETRFKLHQEDVIETPKEEIKEKPTSSKKEAEKKSLNKSK